MFLINLFIVIHIKINFSLVVINRSFYYQHTSDRQLSLITSVFRVLLSNKIVGKEWVKCSKRVILSLLFNKFYQNLTLNEYLSCARTGRYI